MVMEIPLGNHCMTVAFTFQVMVTYRRFNDTDRNCHLFDILFSRRNQRSDIAYNFTKRR